MEILSFLVIATIAALSGVAVLAMRNTVHSALFLVLNFFCLAVLYLSLNAEFLAAVQIIIYAGAIMVLFLFVLTLLNPGHEDQANRLPGQRLLSLMLGTLFLVGICVALFTGTPPAVRGDFPATVPDAQDPTRIDVLRSIAQVLFHQYLLPFEVASVLLLVAMVGAIVLAKRRI